MTNSRAKYKDVTGIPGLAVVPDYYSDADIEQALSCQGVFRNFKPKFIGKVGDRHRFYIGSDGKVIKRIIKSEG